MKPVYFVALFVAVALGAILLHYSSSPRVLGANVVGNETAQVCWNGVNDANDFQVYYGQANTGVKDSAISEGIDAYTRCIKISYLKPCTTYVWNLKRLDGDKWSWQWAKDQAFVTGGTCDVVQTTTNTTPAKAVVLGNGSAKTSWNLTNRANKYYIFYKAADDTNWTYSVEVPSNSTSYTINYLNPNQAYVYRVAALVDGQMVWQEERNLVIQ